MILNAFHGFCMALADSVPGVSGGTIAFILGFYERFLDALHGFFGTDRSARLSAFRYLLNLGVGWCIGMLLCLVLIARLLDQQIYLLSSLFLGLTVASIPSIILSERKSLAGQWRWSFFMLLGAAAVVGLTALRESPLISTAVNYHALRGADYIYLFATGMLAIGAMVLPGISGSSLLMIFGVYVPTVRAIAQLLALEFAVLPGILVLALGFAVGAGLFSRVIQAGMRRYRAQMIWLILGLMVGSLYAICLGPTTMETPLPPLTWECFHPLGFLAGILVLVALEALRRMTERRTQNPAPPKS